jgi:hypothetical protein
MFSEFLDAESQLGFLLERTVMTTLRNLFVVAIGVLAILGSQAGRAQAETESWKITSTYPYQVQIEFYSMDRKPLAWPGSGKAFMLYDSKQHAFSLECNPGERICYGAWEVASGGKTGSRYWGVGQHNSHSCQGCCWTCGRKGNPRAINLTK